ncbi:ABC transporter ATP-binding protein [Limosilactobacillus fermentum]|uniref:ATP-binding cassette domain-containing protein n=1 Tax=Limosilactobacillus fermentum TaxID=1613 RepID=A0A843QZW6_LIMFE|nr:ATP-binding cassette domain-containing protein [Limosilactobacillus fermentum]MPQ35529.1 ATP-binding cassette domain-containing protein [Limosilactobacillus fermentum]
MLKVAHVTKRFGKMTAVDDLSFHVDREEALGLVGQNGAGKSTTFKMILNFLAPDTGKITFDGAPINEHFLNRLGFLPEERGLYMDMTIKEQVTYFANLHDYPTGRVNQELPGWLARLDVKGNEKTVIKNLSKGNQQKVQLITALIHHPELVILDEPFSGLDPINVSLLINLVNELKGEGVAIIFSSHNMKNVADVSDRLLMIVNGQRKLYGPISQLQSHFGRKKVYLEGLFDQVSPTEFAGVQVVEDEYPGKVLTFTNEEAAKAAVEQAQTFPTLSGYRLLPPTLDDLFRETIQKEAHHG